MIDYLDKAGVEKLWEKINNLIDLKMMASGTSSLSFDDIYPVGSVMFTATDTNPGDKFGGTWSKVGQGQVLGIVGTGINQGSNTGSFTQTITEAQLPAHTHSIEHTHTLSNGGEHSHTPTSTAEKFLTSDANIMINGTARNFPSSGGSAYFVYTTDPKDGIDEGITATAGEHTHTALDTIPNTSGSVGSGTPLNTKPPTWGVYAWQRTA